MGVGNIEHSLSFCRDGLGLPTKGIIGQEFERGAVAFFDLSGGLKLALWAQADIVHDPGLPVQPISLTAVTIGHNVARPEEVDQCMAAAERAGAQVVKTPQDTFYGGYAGYFRDPAGTSGKSSGTPICSHRRNTDSSGRMRYRWWRHFGTPDRDEAYEHQHLKK